jgi:pimeloyl-ACP methyl ester carboxylesterase
LAALRAAIEYTGGDAWRRLDEETKQSRLQALGGVAQITVPHVRALLNLKVTDADVRTLSSPTLLIYGTTSYHFEPAIQRRLCDLRPDFQILIVEGAGHNAHREKPDVVNSAIERFLAASRAHQIAGAAH